MKKFISLLMVVSLIAALGCGCSKEETKKESSANASTTASSSKASSSEKSSAASSSGVKKFKDLDGCFRVPTRNILIDVPNWQEIEESFTELFSINGEKYVSVTQGEKIEATDEKDALNKTIEKTKAYLDADGYLTIHKLNADNQKEETINGMKVLRYEGTMTCDKSTKGTYEAYTVGYVFKMHDVYINILGCVTDENQPQATKDEIKKLVDESIQTVRPEE